MGWSREQRRQIASLMRKGTQQQPQQQQQQLQQAPPENSSDANETPVGGKEPPPEEALEGNVGDGNNANVSPEGEGSGVAPGFLSDEDVATLGAPSGDDIDPAMTAIFKVHRRPVLKIAHPACAQCSGQVNTPPKFLQTQSFTPSNLWKEWLPAWTGKSTHTSLFQKQGWGWGSRIFFLFWDVRFRGSGRAG